MGLSETIIAATIGAAATMTTALFQLFSALKANAKTDVRPKRGSTLRSIVAVVALMLVSAVSGYLFSEFRQERAAQDIHSMRDELNAKLQVLAQTTERLAAAREPAAPTMSMAASSEPKVIEASLFLPACNGTECSEVHAETERLCDTLSESLRVTQVELFARSAAQPASWEQSRVQFDQDAGGVKFVGGVVENAIAGQQKSVCVSVAHWSDQPHVARMVLNTTVVPAAPIPAKHDPDTSAPMPSDAGVVNASLGASVAPQLTSGIRER